ncbi:hypothetical protein FRC17_009381, partial [Serendipita sp. 399]
MALAEPMKATNASFLTTGWIRNASGTSRGFRVAGAVGLGLGLGLTTSYLRQPVVLCEPSPTPAVAGGNTTTGAAAPTVPPNAYDPDTPLPAPKSLANPYELTFGT